MLVGALDAVVGTGEQGVPRLVFDAVLFSIQFEAEVLQIVFLLRDVILFSAFIARDLLLI